NFVVLNSARIATDLLEKRSRVYSDRLSPLILNWSGNPILLRYGDLWRNHRRMSNNWLNSRAVTQFHQLQEYQARRMLHRLINVLDDPSPFEQVKRALNTASSTLRLAFGYKLQGDDDQVLHNINQTTHYTARAAMFTNFLVNIFPSLTHIPYWFPGTGWKRTAREWRAFKDHAQSIPYEWTKAQLAAGTAEPSILNFLLQDHDLTSGSSAQEKESCFKELASMITATALVSFVAAMVLNPHIQAKAQKEIDGVLGPTSLPTIADRERLSYVRNLIQEVLRWQPPVPTGVPHACWEDDVYQGYHIERGTVVIGNVWAMTRDESVYIDPEVFDPDRFLDLTVPYAPAFGWGRRKCAGIHFAEASLFITVASLLATFRFSKKKDSDGQEITPQLEVVSTRLSCK
ncbi:cytochrome P450, partial [Rhizoctonia solani]